MVVLGGGHTFSFHLQLFSCIGQKWNSKIKTIKQENCYRKQRYYPLRSLYFPRSASLKDRKSAMWTSQSGPAMLGHSSQWERRAGRKTRTVQERGRGEQWIETRPRHHDRENRGEVFVEDSSHVDALTGTFKAPNWAKTPGRSESCDRLPLRESRCNTEVKPRWISVKTKTNPAGGALRAAVLGAELKPRTPASPPPPPPTDVKPFCMLTSAPLGSPSLVCISRRAANMTGGGYSITPSREKLT